MGNSLKVQRKVTSSNLAPKPATTQSSVGAGGINQIPTVDASVAANNNITSAVSTIPDSNKVNRSERKVVFKSNGKIVHERSNVHKPHTASVGVHTDVNNTEVTPVTVPDNTELSDSADTVSDVNKTIDIVDVSDGTSDSTTTLQLQSQRPKRTITQPVSYNVSTPSKNNPVIALTVYLEVMSIVVTDTEPLTYINAINSSDRKQWKDAMHSELQSLVQHGTGTLVKAPVGANILSNRWVYRIKRDADNQPVKYKARLVVKGFMQKYGFDFWDTYAPTVRMSTILIVFQIVAQRNLELHQLDVDTAFLNAPLKEEVYMKQPQGFVHPTYPGHVRKLNKSLYGLKQAPMKWYNEVNTYFTTKLQFTRVTNEYGLYVYNKNSIYCIVCLYVDDMLIACNNVKWLTQLKSTIGKKWSIKDIGEAKHMLGMSIRRDRTKRKLYVNQSAYIQKIVNKFRMTDSHHTDTPASQLRLRNPGTSTKTLNKYTEIPYREATGSLIYACYTRPDIMYAVGQVCKYNGNFDQSHWTAVKHILRYLNSTSHYELTFDGNCELTLHGYSDADWAGDEDTRRSYSGYTIYLGNSLISWSCNQQSITAQSTTEAEYIALSYAGREITYLRQLLKCLHINQSNPTILYCDNQSSVALSSNPAHHKRTKHIDVRYHHIRDLINDHQIDIKYVHTNDNSADIMTKSLARFKHLNGLKQLGIHIDNRP